MDVKLDEKKSLFYIDFDRGKAKFKYYKLHFSLLIRRESCVTVQA